MGTFGFFADTYDTERLKTLSVWSQIPDEHMRFRGATVMYRYDSIDDLLEHDGRAGDRVLPGVGRTPPTERP